MKSRTIDAFFDIGERIQLIKRKIREADSAEGIAPESKKMPAPGTRAELGGAAPSTTSNTSSSASGSGSAAAKVSASRSSAFGDDDVSTFRPAAPVSADSEVVPPLTLEEVDQAIDIYNIAHIVIKLTKYLSIHINLHAYVDSRRAQG